MAGPLAGSVQAPFRAELQSLIVAFSVWVFFHCQAVAWKDKRGFCSGSNWTMWSWISVSSNGFLGACDGWRPCLSFGPYVARRSRFPRHPAGSLISFPNSC